MLDWLTDYQIEGLKFWHSHPGGFYLMLGIAVVLYVTAFYIRRPR